MTNKKQQIQNIFVESKTRCVESSRFLEINKKNRYLRNSTFALFDEKLPLLGHRSFCRMFPLCWWKKIICENINNFVFVGFLKFCTFRENFFVKSFMSYVKKSFRNFFKVWNILHFKQEFQFCLCKSFVLLRYILY